MVKLELKRAFFHVFICASIILISMQTRIVWPLFYLLVLGLLISVISKNYKIPVISWFLKNFEKKEYQKKFPGKGVLFLIAGCLLVLKLFSNEIAFASIAILAIGDPASHLVAGSFKGKIFKKKSLSGLLLSIILSSTIAALFVPFGYAFIAAVCALAAEVLIIKLGEDPVDDNILIPLVAGTILYLLI